MRSFRCLASFVLAFLPSSKSYTEQEEEEEEEKGEPSLNQSSRWQASFSASLPASFVSRLAKLPSGLRDKNGSGFA